jgi:hypothetical protein
MATQVRNFENRTPRYVLQADAVFELALGCGLLLAAGNVASWLGLNATEISIGGVIALVYGLFILFQAQRNATRRTLQIIAGLNLAWVVISGFILVAGWNAFTNEGRWFVALGADVALVLGLVQLYVQR